MNRNIADDIALLVFTDLDGSLIEHESYSLEPAREALAQLRAQQIPLIFNSSKTAREMSSLQQEQNLSGPFISENGAALFGFQDNVVEFGLNRNQWLTKIHELRETHNYRFLGFSDWTAKEISALTGLSPTQAGYAKRREYSEPILWRDTSTAKTEFVKALNALGLQILEGGRFLSIQSKFDKSHAMKYLVEKMQQAGKRLVVVALGDSPNDEAMLNSADIAIIIKSAKSKGIHCPEAKTVITTAHPGPHGWNDAINEILELKKSKQLDSLLSTVKEQ